MPFDFPFYDVSYTTMVVGPNGIVHFGEAQPPYSLTYLPYAPLNSIAVMHTAMFTWAMPPAPLGVRVSTSQERVDVRWELPHQWNPTAGNIIAMLSLFPDGSIEMHIDIPNNRLAGTLLYGALVGMRGGNVANSITVSRNGIPNLMLGRKAYRLTRPSVCSTERRVVVPTPTPTFAPPSYTTPTPIASPQPTYPVPDGGRVALLRVELAGKSKGILQAGRPMRVSLTSSTAMTVPLFVALDGVACREAASISLLGGYEEFTTRLPLFPYRVRRVLVGHQSVQTIARVTTSKRGRARDDQFDRACSMMVAALKKP